MMNADIRRRCEAIAKLEQQRKELAEEIKELKATAKADGYDVPLITKTVSLMLKDADKQKKAIEQHSLFDSYLAAVGLLPEQEEQSRELEPSAEAGARVVATFPKTISQGDALAYSATSHEPNPEPVPLVPPAGSGKEGGDPAVLPPSDLDLTVPAFLRRAKQTEAA